MHRHRHCAWYVTRILAAQINVANQTQQPNKSLFPDQLTHLLVEREVALGLVGVAPLPAPRWALVHQLVTGGNEFFRRENSPTEEGRRLERWGGPFSDGFEVRAHCVDWER